ncbi:MAG TPA: NAD(P)H-dependent oxidoreductase subunit E [Solirubrobacterales bacterium]|nr:NAD(P)H-dependent oxidoreductase subunit E [Solirubrobacterales bacterium]
MNEQRPESEEQAGDAEGGASAVPEEAGPRTEPIPVPDDLRAEIERRIGMYPDRRSAILPALHLVQSRYGWCTPEGIAQAAQVLDLEPAEVESVASFYDLFHLEPAGEHRVLVCTNISCWMRGADELLDSFCEAAGADRHAAGHGGTVNEAGDVFVSGFECLGACDIAPMISADEHYYGPVEHGEAATVIDQLRQGADVLPDKALAERPAAGGPEPDPDPRVAEVE